MHILPKLIVAFASKDISRNFKSKSTSTSYLSYTILSTYMYPKKQVALQ